MRLSGHRSYFLDKGTWVETNTQKSDLALRTLKRLVTLVSSVHPIETDNTAVILFVLGHFK